jgi:enterochelin esterase family protein
MRSFAVVLLLVLAPRAGARDIVLADILAPAETWREAALPCAPGALAADGAGNVLVADAAGKAIYKIAGGKAEVFARPSAAPAGLAFAGGFLYAALPGKQQVVRYDAAGKEEVVHDRTPAHDLAVRGKSVYYTVPQKKAVYLAGRAEPVAKDAAAAGLVFWKDGRTLVVAGAAGAHLFAYRIDKEGALNAGERYYPLQTRPGRSAAPAALAVDASNILYAACAGGVQVFDPTGRLFGVLSRPRRSAVTALTFGGPGRQSLFVVCGGKLWQRTMKARGNPPDGPRP